MNDNASPRFCSKCGGSLLERGVCCPGCATPAADEKNYCSKCGHKLDERGVYCQHCGEKVACRPQTVGMFVDPGPKPKPVNAPNANKTLAMYVSIALGIIAALASSVSWVNVNYGLLLFSCVSSPSVNESYSPFNLFELPSALKSAGFSSGSSLDEFTGLSVGLLVVWIVMIIVTISGVVATLQGKNATWYWITSTCLIVCGAFFCYFAVHSFNDYASYLSVTSAPYIAAFFAILAAIAPNVAKNKA